MTNEFSDEFIIEVRKILHEDYKKDISYEEATKIARHVVVLFDMLAKNAPSRLKKT